MVPEDDFAAFMERAPGAMLAKLTRGDKVTGTISHIGSDSVFIALGARADGRVPRAELTGRDGKLRVAVGDSLEATVMDPGAEGGPLLAVTLGRDQRLDLESLTLAMESGTPVEAQVTRAVKAGLEVELNGVRAFCPASQIERGYVADVTGYVGQTLRVAVIEIKEDGRSLIVSRKRVIEQERAATEAATLSELVVGSDVTGTVASIQPYGAFVDLGGIEGMVHISELSQSHVDRVEDFLKVGEEVSVRVLSIDDSDKGKRIRLSMKALSQAEASEAPLAGEVLKAKVVRMLPHGLIVSTPKGQGMVPKRELGLPEGGDHRRAFQIDEDIEVVLLDGRAGNYRFSKNRVSEVRAGQDFRDYKKTQTGDTAASMGTLGALLGQLDRGSLPKGPAPKPAPVKAAPPAAAAQPAAAQPEAAPSTPPAPQSEPPKAEAAPPAPASAGAAPRTAESVAGADASEDSPTSADNAPHPRRRIIRGRG